MAKDHTTRASLEARSTTSIDDGATIIADAVGPLTYHAITPYRSVATPPYGPAERLQSGFYEDWDLWTDVNGNAQIPSTIKAVTFNLTITQTIGAAYLAIIPADAPFAGISTINWTLANVDLANNGTVGVGPSDGFPGCVSVICGGTTAATHYLIDVTGYYV